MDPQQQGGLSFRKDLGAVCAAAKCGACIWTAIMRQEFGARYPGLYGLVCGLALMLGASVSADPVPVLGFIAGWMFLLLIRRVQATILSWRGPYHHSMYDGVPSVVMSLIPWLKSETMARNIEPLLCGGIAYGVMQVYSSLGNLLMLGAVALALVRVFDARTMMLQITHMRDQEIVMRNTLARFRGWNEY